MARRLFDELRIDFEEIALDGDPDLRWKIAAKAGNWTTVPMIFIGDHFIGGYTETASLHRDGRLLRLIGRE